MKPCFARACVAGFSLALMSCGTSEAKQTPPQARPTSQGRGTSASQNPDETATAAMARAAAGKMKLDGARVTRVLYVDHCHTAFVTSAGKTVLDWSKVGNFAPSMAAGLEVTDLAQPGGNHRLTMPLGHDSDDVQSTIGIMASDCMH